MSLYIRLCFIFVLCANEIICRSVELNTFSTVIDAASQSNNTMSNNLFTSTEPTTRSFDICEEFEYRSDAESLKLRDRDFVVTVVMKVF